VEDLESSLHPNHFFIFQVKKKIALKTQVVKDTSTEDLKLLVQFIGDVLAVNFQNLYKRVNKN